MNWENRGRLAIPRFSRQVPLSSHHVHWKGPIDIVMREKKIASAIFLITFACYHSYHILIFKLKAVTLFYREELAVGDGGATVFMATGKSP